MNYISDEVFPLAVAGLHLSGEPLNYQLTELGAKLNRVAHTAPNYKMYLIEDENGKKPGLVRVMEEGVGERIELEIWDLPITVVGIFINYVPQPLGIGTLSLESGEKVKGFICEPWVALYCKDISLYQSWKKYLYKK